MPAQKNTRASASQGSAAQSRQLVLDMLKEDHKRAKKAFRDFEKLDAQSDAEQCLQLVEQTCAELQIHTTLEEEVFYPALRQALKEQDLLDEAQVEHDSAKQLIEQLQNMGDQIDGKFTATFTVLGEYVKHHIKEEESEMFEQAEKVKLDWAAIAQQMQERKAQLTEELLPQQADSLLAADDAS